MRQAEGGFEEEGESDSRTPLSPGGGGVRGGPGDDGGFEELGSLEHSMPEGGAGTKDQESLAFFQVENKRHKRAGFLTFVFTDLVNRSRGVRVGSAIRRSPHGRRSDTITRAGKWPFGIVAKVNNTSRFLAFEFRTDEDRRHFLVLGGGGGVRMRVNARCNRFHRYSNVTYTRTACKTWLNIRKQNYGSW